MSHSMPPRDWGAIFWPDIAPEKARDWIAVLPIAAIEQHGPHLPLGTDAIIAEAYLARVREILDAEMPAVFLPVQAIGISAEHASFPGTLTLPASAAMAAWQAIGESVARAGVRKLVIVNSHGGNSAAMSLVAQELRARAGLFVVTTAWHRFGYPAGLFDDMELRHGIHGGAVETSLVLASRPDLARMDKAANFTPSTVAVERDTKWLGGRTAPYAWMAEDLHASGAAGDVTLASAEKGRLTLDCGARGFCQLLKEVQGFDLGLIAQGPLG
jgi:creatinine amidohydrolase